MAADPNKPYGDVAYADPGYQADKKKRYPIDTKPHAKSAWSYINQADNAKAYTPNQLKRIKGRIVKALKKFGVTVAAEGWSIDPAFLVTEAVAEYYGDPDMCGSYSLSASNGPTNICVSGYGLDPADLEEILRAACEGACRALAALDPDMDGDIDAPGADAEDTDGDMGDSDGDDDDKPSLAQRLLAAALGSESVPDDQPDAVTETETAPQDPAPVEAAANPQEEEEPAMAEPTTQETAVTQAPVAENTPTAAPGSVTLTNDQFQQLLAAVRPPAQPAAPAAPAPVAAESAPAPAQAAQETAPAAPPAPAPAAPVAETQEQMIARLVEERLAAERTRIVQETVEAGGLPARKGLVQPVSEHRAPGPESAGGEMTLNDYGVPNDWPNKPLHQYTTEERQRYFGPAIERHALGSRASV